jgi:hypothetical protein
MDRPHVSVETQPNRAVAACVPTAERPWVASAPDAITNSPRMAAQRRFIEQLGIVQRVPIALPSASAASAGGVVQRETVSGVTNAGKTAQEIGADVHLLVQEQFLSGSLSDSWDLYTEAPIGGGRCDLVAVNDERDEDGLGDCVICVGEIKSDANAYYGAAGAYAQLANYINAYRISATYSGATVGRLDFWNPPVNGIPLDGGGYNCTVFIRNAGNGLYTYTGRVQDDAIARMTDRLSDDEEQPEPFNTQGNYNF